MTLVSQPSDTGRVQRVLIAGGQPDLRHMISSTLRMSGYQVVSADSDHTVFSLAKAFQPDVVIVDFKMGRLNSPMARKRLEVLSSFSGIPVIVISPESDIAVIESCLQAGAQDYIAMPFSPGLLVERVSQLVG